MSPEQHLAVDWWAHLLHCGYGAPGVGIWVIFLSAVQHRFVFVFSAHHKQKTL